MAAERSEAGAGRQGLLAWPDPTGGTRAASDRTLLHGLPGRSACRPLDGLPYLLSAGEGAYRCAIDPEFRRHELAKAITSRSIAILKRWSDANPNEQVLGLAAVIQAPELRGMALRPVWPEYELDLNLACYLPSGEQLRVAWFPNVKIQAA